MTMPALATGLPRLVSRTAPMIVALALVSGCQVKYPTATLPPADALPEPTTTYLDLGRTLLRQNRIDLARDAFIRSLRTEGSTAAALTGAGIAAERQGLLSEAQRFFERAKALAPGSVLAHNNLGAVHYRLGEYHAARRAFRTAFALSSGTNQVAAKNLTMSELAIARASEGADVTIRNPVQIQRLGSGHYSLQPDEPEQSGEE
ncbi:MAG: tetratricopeptide repeat protein [Pseudomonadota bacterium]